MTRLALLLLVVLPSCAYARARGNDFLDMFRVVGGVGTATGVRARAGGVIDTGLMMDDKPRKTAYGLRYGTVMLGKETGVDTDNAKVIATKSVENRDPQKGTYESARTSFAILPALFTWTDTAPEKPPADDDYFREHWIWSGETFRNNRYTQIHALDFELELALFLYLDVGVSPGEFLDFLLGIFTIDIAKDDGR